MIVFIYFFNVLINLFMRSYIEVKTFITKQYNTVEINVFSVYVLSLALSISLRTNLSLIMFYTEKKKKVRNLFLLS